MRRGHGIGGFSALWLGLVLFAPISQAGATPSSPLAIKLRAVHAGIHCPQALPYGGQAPEGVIRAARTGMHMIRRDASRYRIIAVASLAQVAARINGSASYRYQAAHLCGNVVAERSWFVTVYVPGFAHTSSPEGFAFVAKTTSGWRIWYVPLGI